ncbi:MAG TPA: hypothetical protein P5234_05800 [Thermoanaerobaculaceae bacterium]|nr:hypothetical protein [Thermoanaerobaculaceae bacterium]HRS15750.1 hypothetical protein [Thermoanaerobaculaceae bacterium]
MRALSAASTLALWVGRKGRGVARLRWGQGELRLHITGLQVVAVEGDDREKLSAAFGLTSGGEWFAEARSAVSGGLVTQGEANAVVKLTLAERLHEFFLAPDAEVSFDAEVQPEPQGLTVSFPHLVMEMVLGPGGEALEELFLPSADLVLRRLPDFARRVGALGLTEEGMAVLAKINDHRTAREIADPSPHGRDMALRLLAAAVGGGIAEAAPRVAEVTFAAPLAAQAPPVRRRRRWWPWVLAAAILIGAVAALLLALPSREAPAAVRSGPWGLAIDGGCQPAELERLYRKQEQDRANLRVVPYGEGSEQCFNLVWGGFATREEAQAAAVRAPSSLVARAFVVHPVNAGQHSP